jgi:hypothetical protein
MSITTLTTSSADPETAHQQFLDKLRGFEFSAQSLEDWVVKDLLHNEQKLKVWADIIHKKHEGRFDALDTSLKNMLIAKSARLTSHTLVVSSAFNMPTKQNGQDFSYDHCEAVDAYHLPDGSSVSFMKESGKKRPNAYDNSFDFVSFSPNPKHPYVQVVSVPYQSIDYRICAAMSEAGIMERFSSHLSALIDNTGHDFVHNALKNRDNYPINNRVKRTNIDHYNERNGIIGEELWALMTNSAIYERLKHHGFAKKIAEQGAELFADIHEFERNSNHPERNKMADALRTLVSMHLSNYVKRENVLSTVESNHNTPTAQQLETLLLRGKPGNKIRSLPTLPLREVDSQPDWSADNLKNVALNHLVKWHHNDIYQLAAESFDTINQEFAKHSAMNTTLEALHQRIDSQRSAPCNIPEASTGRWL